MTGPRNRFEPKYPSPDIIKKFREETGAGMMQAKRIASRCREEDAFRRLIAEGTVEEKVDWLLRRYAEGRFSGGHPADDKIVDAFRRLDFSSEDHFDPASGD